MEKHELLNLLKMKYDIFTDSQKKIAQYLMDYYDFVVYMSSQDFAKAVGVSDVTIIRFARTIGFSGYATMKQSIKDGFKAVDAPDIRAKKTLDNWQEQSNLLPQIVNRDIENLQKFIESFDVKVLDKAVKFIYNARRIYLAGKGTSSVIVQFLELHFRRMGFLVCSVNESITISHEKLIGMNEQDLLIACAYPRYSKDTCKAISYAKKVNAHTIAITDSELSPLALNGDLIFTTNMKNMTFFHSYVIPMELCNLLLMKVLRYGGNKIYKQMKANIRGLDMFDLTL